MTTLRQAQTVYCEYCGSQPGYPCEQVVDERVAGRAHFLRIRKYQMEHEDDETDFR